jgi:hypothetical protein
MVPLHLSLSVQPLLSLQDAPLLAATWVQPMAASQEATAQVAVAAGQATAGATQRWFWQVA